MDGPVPVASLLCQPNNRKRTHDQISDHSRASSCSVHEGEPTTFLPFNNPRPPTRSNPNWSIGSLRMPSSRFRGDGLDMRTPVMSTHPPSNVIDLTEDSPEAANNNSQPRNRAASERDHHVHLVSARPSLRPLRERIPRRTAIEAEAEGSNTVDIRESSPEVEFVSARPRSVSQSDQSRQNRPAQPGNVPGRPPSFRTRRGNLSDTSQMMGLRLPDNMRTAIAGITGPFRFGGFMARSGQEELVTINDLEVEHFEGIDMGVGMQGFNLDNPSRPVQQPRLPTYEAPPPARSGYTRDLKEEDILVCPNCDDELGVGEEEMKRQVWVIKGCGHVYCGECARSRPPKTSKKNAASPRFSKSTPFKTCKVDGCQKNITRSNFIQVYL